MGVKCCVPNKPPRPSRAYEIHELEKARPNTSRSVAYAMPNNILEYTVRTNKSEVKSSIVPLRINKDTPEQKTTIIPLDFKEEKLKELHKTFRTEAIYMQMIPEETDKKEVKETPKVTATPNSACLWGIPNRSGLCSLCYY